MIKADLHTHTCHSHAQDTTRRMLEAGAGKQLLVLGFSEHSTRPAAYRYPTEEFIDHLDGEFDDYIREVEELKQERRPGMPEPLLGLEAEWLEGEPAFMRSLVSAHDYDYVTAGIHFLGTWGFDASGEDWARLEKREKHELYARYYRTMKAMAESRLFNIAAHPDLVKIYSADDFREWLRLPGSMDAVADALSAVRDAGMAMEFSSAGLRKACREAYPGPAILHLAAELGVPLAFGSDSHAAGQTAWGFDELARQAAAEGWRECAVFRKRTMEFMPF